MILVTPCILHCLSLNENILANPASYHGSALRRNLQTSGTGPVLSLTEKSRLAGKGNRAGRHEMCVTKRLLVTGINGLEYLGETLIQSFLRPRLRTAQPTEIRNTS